MKNKIYLFFILTIFLAACSSNDDPVAMQEEEAFNLIIVDYNPKETYTAEEIVIQTEGIDSTASIEVFFSGIQAPFYEIDGNSLRTRVPTGASSGEFSVVYNTEEISVGPIDIIEETDILYGERSNSGENNTLHHINMSDGTTGELVYAAVGYDQVGGISFSKESNTFMNWYSILCGSSGCSSHIVLRNRDNELRASIHICTDLDCNEGVSSISFSNGKYIYEYRYDTFPGFPVHNLYSIDLYTMERTLLRDYLVEGESNITGGLYIDSTNEILGFRNENL